MELRYIVWKKGRQGQVSPLVCQSPAGITTSEAARADARKLVLERRIPAHSLLIEDEEGNVVEHWLWRRNKWVEQNAPEPGLEGVLLQRR